jgi:hypothetical protein
MRQESNSQQGVGPSIVRRCEAPSHLVSKPPTAVRYLELLLSVVVVLGAGACSGNSDKPAPASEQRANSYLDPRYLSEGIERLFQPLPKPVRVLSLTALHGVIVVQVQDHTDLTRVVEYRYSNGSVSGPNPVKLSGPGKLTENLFPLAALDPHSAAEQALNTVRRERSEAVRKLVLSRNLPHSMDIQFRVFLQTPKGDQVITADKAGRLLGPLTPEATATNSEPPRTL